MIIIIINHPKDARRRRRRRRSGDDERQKGEQPSEMTWRRRGEKSKSEPPPFASIVALLWWDVEGTHQNHPFGAMMMDEATRRVETMIEAIVASARLAREVDDERNRGQRVGHGDAAKEDDSLVTVADFAIQRLVSDTLHGALGEFLVGEETCPTEGDVFDRVEELVAKYAPKKRRRARRRARILCVVTLLKRTISC